MRGQELQIERAEAELEVDDGGAPNDVGVGDGDHVRESRMHRHANCQLPLALRGEDKNRDWLSWRKPTASFSTRSDVFVAA